MTVYVDDMRAISPSRHWRYTIACHMLADSDSELEEMAELIELKRSWRHGDHYDLAGNKRRLAVKQGAVEITTREMVRFRKQRGSG